MSTQDSDQGTAGERVCQIPRKFTRFAVELPCFYSFDQGGPDWNGTAVNLSRGGCAIIGTTPVEKGCYLRILIFPSTSHPPIEIGLAPVRWANNEQFGVEFITISHWDKKRLNGYVDFLGGK